MKKYSIGEFSKLSGITQKTLRYYHTCGILIPASIDPDTGYRFYDEQSCITIRAINILKHLDFSISDMKEILDMYPHNNISPYLRKKIKDIDDKVKKYAGIRNKLEAYLQYEKKYSIHKTQKIVVKHVKDMLVAGIRFRGQYTDYPVYFKKILENCGNYWNGRSIIMEYEHPKSQNKRDLEMVIPVSQKITTGDIKSRILAGGKAITIQYTGPHETVAVAYKALVNYVKSHNLEIIGPPRQIDIGSWWSIVPRKKNDYSCEIQFFVK